MRVTNSICCQISSKAQYNHDDRIKVTVLTKFRNLLYKTHSIFMKNFHKNTRNFKKLLRLASAMQILLLRVSLVYLCIGYNKK